MSSGWYLGTALGGALRRELTADDVAEMWEATDEDLRERDDDGGITLWARSEDRTFRLAPVRLAPIRDAAA